MTASNSSNIVQLHETRKPSLSPCTASILPPQCDRLKPAGLQQGTAELMACLTLVCPSGMTADERSQWVAVARQTLSGIPADLLARGCEAARQTCRFPSEIIPAIMAEVGDTWKARRRGASQPVASDAPRLAAPDYVSAEQAKDILAEFGLRSLSRREA